MSSLWCWFKRCIFGYAHNQNSGFGRTLSFFDHTHCQLIALLFSMISYGILCSPANPVKFALFTRKEVSIWDLFWSQKGSSQLCLFPITLWKNQAYSLAHTSNESINSYQLLFIITSVVLESALRHELLHTLCQMKSVLLKRHYSFLFYGCFSLQEKSMSHTTVAGSRKNDILLFNTPALGAEGSVDRGTPP